MPISILKGEEMDKIIAARFSEQERKRIEAEAVRLGLKVKGNPNLSMVIRIAVAEYFENHKKEIEGDKK